MGEREASGQRIQALERGIEIVEHLEEADGLTVSGLAGRMDVPTSTAHVYLKTLHDLGYAVKDGSTYRVGLRFLKHGGHARQRSRLYRTAHAEVDEIARETNEVSALGTEENGSRVLLYKSEGSEAVYDDPPVGEYTRMHWTALGKAILANLPEERVGEVVDRRGLPAATDHTITSRAALDEELATIRDQGYAVEDEERWEGIRSVAVPIVDGDEVLGSLSVSGPKRRFDYDRIENDLVERLGQSKNVVELQLAHE